MDILLLIQVISVVVFGVLLFRAPEISNEPVE